MKRLIAVLCALALAGCANMTPEQERTAWIVGGILVTGAIIASQADSGGTPAPECRTHYIVGPNGSTPVTRCD